MTDISDQASVREDEDRARALAAQARRAGLAGKTVADSATHCQDCDEPIPEPRRYAVLGVKTCIDCQLLKEKNHER